MSVSKDPSTGTDQNTAAFWSRVHSAYNANVVRANKNRESDHDRKVLHTDRPPASLKGQWYSSIQRTTQIFAF